MSQEERRAMALNAVRAETYNQDEKWGADRDHDPEIWMTILMEEVGELAQACLKAKYEGEYIILAQNEAVQVAAVAVQIIEYFERKFDETH